MSDPIDITKYYETNNYDKLKTMSIDLLEKYNNLSAKPDVVDDKPIRCFAEERMDNDSIRKYQKYFAKTKDLIEHINTCDLLKYPETQFVSKNKNLQSMIENLRELKVTRDEEIYYYFETNDWINLDAYIRSYPGKINFFRILTQFFLFRYYTPDDKKITRKQFQIALGIQQVRWMVDDENPNKKIERKIYTALIINEIYDASLVMWDDIPIEIKNKFLTQDGRFYKIFKDKMSLPYHTHEHEHEHTIDKYQQIINKFFAGTVWYRMTQNINSLSLHIPLDPNKQYFPIPETLNLSKNVCQYVPTLIFGSMSETSLLKYQLIHNMRPYAAHLPDSASNLVIIHGSIQPIVSNWAHDFIHQQMLKSCDITSTYTKINERCRKIPIKMYEEEKYDEISSENIVSHIDNNGTFQQCMNNSIDNKLARLLNDSGALYGPVPVIE